MTEELSELLTVLEADGRHRIIVTGPQRSGTRIAAKILAHELGYTYVDEDAIGVDNEQAFWQLLLPGQTAERDEPGNWVLQAPGLSHMVHRLPYLVAEAAATAPTGRPEDYAVVWMLRDEIAIVKSELRIGWRQRGFHLVERKKMAEEAAIADYAAKEHASIATCKKAAWLGRQKTLLGDHAHGLHYDALEGHQLWVPAVLREKFHHDQTEL